MCIEDSLPGRYCAKGFIYKIFYFKLASSIKKYLTSIIVMSAILR